MAERDNPKPGGAQQRVQIEIFGDIYRLRTDDEEGLKRLAKIVDGTMRSIAQNAKTLATARLGVLAALKLADDYYQLKRDYDELLELLDEKK
mgnify:CR=1 FL=1